MKNKLSFIKRIPKNIVQFYKDRSMSTQLIITIILIFISFFALQFILNFEFFEGYYTNEEYNRVHEELIEYVNNMNDIDAEDYATSLTRLNVTGDGPNVELPGTQLWILSPRGTWRHGVLVEAGGF